MENIEVTFNDGKVEKYKTYSFGKHNIIVENPEYKMEPGVLMSLTLPYTDIKQVKNLNTNFITYLDGHHYYKEPFTIQELYDNIF